jgi:membrane protein DedA with SNARE-associated domain
MRSGPSCDTTPHVFRESRERRVTQLSNWAKTFVESYGLWAIFVTMLLESAFIPIPSEVVVPLGGVLAAQGHVALWQVVVVATLANLVGSLIIYALGRYAGREVVLRYGRYVRITSEHLDRADRWFERWGSWAVFITRMLPGVRSVISLPAGIARMPVVRFAIFTTLGSIPWNLALAYLGYLFGANWEQLQGYFHRYDLVIYGLVAASCLAVMAWAWWRGRRLRLAG